MTLGSKKGNVPLAVLIAVLMITLFAIIAIFAQKVFQDFNTEIQSDDSFNAASKTDFAAQSTSFGNTFDALVVTALVLFWIFMLISSFLIRSHPIFFVISLIVLLFILGFSAFMGNMYEEITDDAEFSSSVAQFPMTNWVATHMLVVAIAMSMTTLISIYGGWKLS